MSSPRRNLRTAATALHDANGVPLREDGPCSACVRGHSGRRGGDPIEGCCQYTPKIKTYKENCSGCAAWSGSCTGSVLLINRQDLKLAIDAHFKLKEQELSELDKETYTTVKMPALERIEEVEKAVGQYEVRDGKVMCEREAKSDAVQAKRDKEVALLRLMRDYYVQNTKG